MLNLGINLGSRILEIGFCLSFRLAANHPGLLLRSQPRRFQNQLGLLLGLLPGRCDHLLHFASQLEAAGIPPAAWRRNGHGLGLSR